MKPIRFLPGAEDDAVAATKFYEDRAPGLGADFEDALDSALQRLEPSEQHRQVGSAPEGAVRSAPLRRRFPQQVVFIECADELLVLAVEHPSRMPRWPDRI